MRGRKRVRGVPMSTSNKGARDPMAPVRLVLNNGVEVPRKAPPDGDGPDIRPVEFSDDALAKLLSERLGADWRCTPDGEWRRWSGRLWEADRLRSVFHHSRHVCRAAANACENASVARKVSSSNTIFAAVKLAGHDPRHATEREMFDRNDWLLGTPGGIIDLRSGATLPHAREHLMTRSTGAAPEGDCPVFYSFLRAAFGGDHELIAYLQRWMGYTLSGDTSEHAVLLIHGPGGTGKSVLLGTWAAMLGTYATMASMDTFVVQTGERHPADLAMLDGARLVTASETEEGRRWDEAKLKAITGGDLITARRMRQDFFTFKPRFKLVVAGNYRPAMRSADDAMRRRFHVLPMLHKPETIDKSLADRLRAELGGILKWAAHGAGEWLRTGLKPPAAVTSATDQYFEDENSIGLWLKDRCHKSEGKITSTAALFADWKSWANRVGEYTGTERRFAQRLTTMGFERARDPDTARRGFRGVVLRGVTDDLPLNGAAGGGGLGSSLETDEISDPWEH